MMLPTYTLQPIYHQVTTSEIQPRQDFKGQGRYGKVKSKSHHVIANLHPNQYPFYI